MGNGPGCLSREYDDQMDDLDCDDEDKEQRKPSLSWYGQHASNEWTKKFGLDDRHPDLLRQYYAGNSLTDPAWSLGDDQEIWTQLRIYLQACKESREKVERGESVVFPCPSGHHIWLEMNGKREATVVSAPGSRIDLQVRGWILQHGSVSWTSHLLFAMDTETDTEVVSEMYDGTPSKPFDEFCKNVAITAPTRPGVYMLSWYHRCGLPKDSHLQTSWLVNTISDTRRNFKEKKEDRYPGGSMLLSKDYQVAFHGFVGWLVVET